MTERRFASLRLNENAAICRYVTVNLKQKDIWSVERNYRIIVTELYTIYVYILLPFHV